MKLSKRQFVGVPKASLVLGDELAFGQAFLTDVLRMQRGLAVGQEAHQERRAEFELLRIAVGGL